MKSEGKAPPERKPAEGLPAGQSATSGFGLLARRISSWTTNGLLSAAILVAGLAFGRQVLDWWASDETAAAQPPTQVAMTDGLGDPSRPHQLHFADAPWAMRRETVAGDRDAASESLQATCRELTVAADPPSDGPEASEARFLDSLGPEALLAEEPGRWQLYQVETAFPMVVGIRTVSSGSAADPPDQVAQPSRRVVTWSLAVPAADQAWTLYTFHPANAAAGPTADLAEIPLPPDSRKTISIRVVAGGAVVAFVGPPEPTAWKAFFDRSMDQREWTALGTWRRSGSTWHLRYAGNSDRRDEMIDVQFGPDGHGRLAGLLMMTPTDRKPTESESL